MAIYSTVQEQPTPRTDTVAKEPSAYGTMEPTGLITFPDHEPERSALRSPVSGRGAARVSPANPLHDLSKEEIDDLKVFGLIARHWKLSDQEAAGLLGVDLPTWKAMESTLKHSAKTRWYANFASKSSDAPYRWSTEETLPHVDHECLPLAGDLATAYADEFAAMGERGQRVCVLYCIFVTLQQLYRQEENADRWVRCRNYNRVFGGKPPIEVMVDGGLPSFLDTRDYLLRVASR